jgi:hypothetical protein
MLLAHGFYRISEGENRYVRQQAGLLSRDHLSSSSPSGTNSNREHRDCHRHAQLQKVQNERSHGPSVVSARTAFTDTTCLGQVFWPAVFAAAEAGISLVIAVSTTTACGVRTESLSGKVPGRDHPGPSLKRPQRRRPIRRLGLLYEFGNGPAGAVEGDDQPLASRWCPRRRPV